MALEDLDVLGTLGRGSFGIVRLVRHSATGMHFACKCQAKKKIIDESMENYVTIECKILAMCDNPFVLKLYSSMQTDKYVYLVLELLDGGELYHHLQKLVCFAEPMLRFFIAQVACAFECLHSKDVLYRDLKPENLVLDSDGYLKVVDFGLSKVLKGWKTWTMCGTPEYLAPEILRSEGHNQSVDFWMLGVPVAERGTLLRSSADFLQRRKNARVALLPTPHTHARRYSRSNSRTGKGRSSRRTRWRCSS